MVRHRATETDVLQTHVLERKQCPQALVKAARTASELVVLLAEPLDGDSDTDVRELPGQSDYPVLEPAGGGNHDPGSMPEAFLDNFFKVLTDKRLASGEINELQLRKRLKIRSLDLLLLVGRILPDIAHLATHRTTIRQNNACVRRTRNGSACHISKSFISV